MDRLSSQYSFQVHTFGCKVNTYDSGLLEDRLRKSGASVLSRDLARVKAGGLASENGSGTIQTLADQAVSKPRVHIMNTCAVTAEATKEAVKQIRRIKSKDPFAVVVATGCAAQVDGATLDQLAAADLVVANSHKGQLEFILDDFFRGKLAGQKVFRSNIFRKDDLEAGGGIEAGHTRGFLKIQDGCNSFCTYCVIPFARGKSRSISVKDLVARVKELRALQNIQEIVLTGVHIGDYEDASLAEGRKLVLEDLIAEILAKTDVPRLRLTSLEPVEVTDRLLDLFSNPRMCRHFHMSIQAANTKILSLMKRRYTAVDVEASLQKIQERVPGAFVGMDVIAGFPGETHEDFQDGFERLMRLPWTRIHVFPYSERPGTKAILLSDSVARPERARRASLLRSLSGARFQSEAEKQIGTFKDVLVLSQASKGAETLSRDYWPVKMETAFASMDEVSGRELQVEIVKVESHSRDQMDGILVGRVGGKSVKELGR